MSTSSIREDEQTNSPSESTTSLLKDPAVSNVARSAHKSGSLSGMNIVVTGRLSRVTSCIQPPMLTNTFSNGNAACASIIGQAVCFELAQQGANLALTDPSKGAGQELCRELHKSGYTGALLFSAIDLRDFEKLSSYIKNVSRTLKKIDGLVNCATFSPEVSLPYLSTALYLSI